MHIPDGLLSTGTAAGAWVVSGATVAYAVHKARGAIDQHRSLLMGVGAAFVFAAQMFNFPIAGGTSGHLVGGALLTILMGPWQAMLVLTSVLIVQALVFQDGGLLALGANVLNMAVISPLVAFAVYGAARRLIKEAKWRLMIGGFAASWLSIVLAAFAASIELSVSGTLAFVVVAPAMVLVHMLIGIGEGLITVAVLVFIRAVRPDLLSADQSGIAAEASS